MLSKMSHSQKGELFQLYGIPKIGTFTHTESKVWLLGRKRQPPAQSSVCGWWCVGRESSEVSGPWLTKGKVKVRTERMR